MTSHRPAPLVLRWWLRVTGFEGITMPWRTAYYLHWPPPGRLIAHEEAHTQDGAPVVINGRKVTNAELVLRK